MAQRQPAGDMRAEPPPAGLRPGLHHLELAPADAGRRVHGGEERLEVGPGADEHPVGVPGFPAGGGIQKC